MAVVLDGCVVLSDFIGQVDPSRAARRRSTSTLSFGWLRSASCSRASRSCAFRVRQLALDDPLSKYVPEIAGVVYPQGEAPPITLRQLLTHASGLPHDLPGFWELARPIHEGRRRWPPWKGLELRFTPGSDMAYTNLGLGLLGLVVQRVSGRPYRDYLRDDVLIPIGMTDAAWAARRPKDRSRLAWLRMRRIPRRSDSSRNGRTETSRAMEGSTRACPDMEGIGALSSSVAPARRCRG